MNLPLSLPESTCWPCDIVQALIKISTKSQTLQACWPCHVVQVPIEECSKSHTSKACWPRQAVQALIAFSTKVRKTEGEIRRRFV